MFWKKKNAQPQVERVEVRNFPRYVVEKIIPRIDSAEQSASFIRLANMTFERGGNTNFIEKSLISEGISAAMISALTLAYAIEEATGHVLSDVEYGDCYLCAIFCMASVLRDTPEAAISALEKWAERFEQDVDYLLFDDKDALSDLTESGWDRFMRYHDHQDAILPQAYLHLLSQVIRHRRIGHDTPYHDLDPMIMSDPIVFASVEQAWETKAFASLRQWTSTLVKVQMAAEEWDVEFWNE